jgi:hypothetical protein
MTWFLFTMVYACAWARVRGTREISGRIFLFSVLQGKAGH